MEGLRLSVAVFGLLLAVGLLALGTLERLAPTAVVAKNTRTLPADLLSMPDPDHPLAPCIIP